MVLPTLLQAAPASGLMSGLPSLLMMGGLFAVFYFLLIRPQQKRAKELEKKRSALKSGDRFITAGGVYATFTHFKENETVVVAEIAPGVRVEILKSTILSVIDDAKKTEEKK